jgi:SOS response regulatory protein OraA/RecX
LETVDSETELAQLQELVARKHKQSRYQERDKLMAYLARQGYGYDLIKQALDDN